MNEQARVWHTAQVMGIDLSQALRHNNRLSRIDGGNVLSARSTWKFIS